MTGPQIHRRLLQNATLLVVVVCGMMLSFGLFLFGQLSVRRQQACERASAHASTIAGVVSTSTHLAPDDVMPVLEHLTGNPEILPFVFDGDQGPSRDIPMAVEEAVKTSVEGWLRQGNRVFAWARINNRQSVGVQMELPTGDYLAVLPFFGAFVLLSALLLWMVVRISHRRVGRWAADRAHVIGGIPDEPRGFTVSCPFGELAPADDAIQRILGRHAEVRDGHQVQIDAGRESRGKKAHVFASMSHDLKSPLNSIIGFTDLLLKGIDGELEAEQRCVVQSIGRESEKLMVMIGDILDTAKLDAGRFELDRQWVPSVEILTDCESGARKLTGSSDIDFVCELEPGLPPVKVDKERVTRAILGLIARAVDSVDQGVVRLKASRARATDQDGGYLKVEVIDTGRRLSEAQRERLFTLFQATEGVMETGEVGAARLGLALSRRIVRLQGGDVYAESTRDTYGKGSIFTVTLPLDDEAKQD